MRLEGEREEGGARRLNFAEGEEEEEEEEEEETEARGRW
jgi:hypothetical protein